jgi:hypothetical protein
MAFITSLGAGLSKKPAKVTDGITLKAIAIPKTSGLIEK